MKNTLLYSAAALIATSAAANAQSIDYQVMGDMFGEPVTTGATGAPQRSTEVPATMIIITRMISPVRLNTTSPAFCAITAAWMWPGSPWARAKWASAPPPRPTPRAFWCW